MSRRLDRIEEKEECDGAPDVAEEEGGSCRDRPFAVCTRLTTNDVAVHDETTMDVNPWASYRLSFLPGHVPIPSERDTHWPNGYSNRYTAPGTYCVRRRVSVSVVR